MGGKAPIEAPPPETGGGRKRHVPGPRKSNRLAKLLGISKKRPR